MDGKVNSPTMPPTMANWAQSQDGIPEHDGAREKNATIFETSTPIIAPLNRPVTAVKHPTPMLRCSVDGARSAPAVSATVSTRRADAPPG